MWFVVLIRFQDKVWKQGTRRQVARVGRLGGARDLLAFEVNRLLDQRVSTHQQLEGVAVIGAHAVVAFAGKRYRSRKIHGIQSGVRGILTNMHHAIALRFQYGALAFAYSGWFHRVRTALRQAVAPRRHQARFCFCQCRYCFDTYF